MKINMIDASLFTGRYDDSLCAALAGERNAVTLMGRPMRLTDAIVPRGYQYNPCFFRWSEVLRARLGEGGTSRLVKAVSYGAWCAIGDLTPLAGADLVHFQWLPLPLCDRLMLRRIKGRTALVHTVHNAEAYHAETGLQGRGYRSLLDMFDALIVHGEVTRVALVRQGVDSARIHVTPHPPMTLAAANAADMVAVPDAVMPRVLFFGTIRPYKGVDLLVDSCISLWRTGERFELVLAGKPFMEISPLVQSVRAAGFGDRLITDFGFLPEGRLDAHMAKADIIVFPYRHIDSSGAFLSALRHGKAMVTSDVGMFATLPDGVAARVPAGDASALAQAISVLVENTTTRRVSGLRAREYGESIGSWKDMAVATINVYRHVLAGR